MDNGNKNPVTFLANPLDALIFGSSANGSDPSRYRFGPPPQKPRRNSRFSQPGYYGCLDFDLGNGDPSSVFAWTRAWPIGDFRIHIAGGNPKQVQRQRNPFHAGGAAALWLIWTSVGDRSRSGEVHFSATFQGLGFLVHGPAWNPCDGSPCTFNGPTNGMGRAGCSRRFGWSNLDAACPKPQPARGRVGGPWMAVYGHPTLCDQTIDDYRRFAPLLGHGLDRFNPLVDNCTGKNPEKKSSCGTRICHFGGLARDIYRPNRTTV